MDKIRVPFHGSNGADRLVAIGLAAGALIAALAALGFFSVVWFLTHSD